MKYIIKELQSGVIIGIYYDIEDLVGNDYYYFRHLVVSDKSEYIDTVNNKCYLILKDENFTDAI